MKPASDNPFLYRDQDWLVVHKPTGISTHAANDGDLGVSEWLTLHHGLKVHVCSRLDKGTSGVLVMALNPAASAKAQQIHERLQAKKTYYFISDKKPAGKPQWVSRTPLDGHECETRFELVKSGTGNHLYRAEIESGKQHQIRRHASASGVPILGDDDYKGSPFTRLCLHCRAVSWPGIPGKLSAEIPQSFEWLLAGRDRRLIDAAAAHERRLNWLTPITDAFRAIHRGEIEGLDVAVDVFGPWMCVTGFDETMSSTALERDLEPLIAYMRELYACKGGIFRTHRQDPHKRKLFGGLTSWGTPPPESYFVREHGLFYEISLNDAQHPGLFLDQRDSRRRVARAAKGKRVANLFAFTCSFSAAAVKAGAEVVFSVDLSAGCLQRGKNNFSRSGIAELNRGKFIKEDVRAWLARQLRQKQADPDGFSEWDLIVCDPPVFASAGKGQSFSVEKSWPDLASQTRGILSQNGVALFVNNQRRGDDEYYFSELKKKFSKVTQLRPPIDFPIAPKTPTHVRIYWCEA